MSFRIDRTTRTTWLAPPGGTEVDRISSTEPRCPTQMTRWEIRAASVVTWSDATRKLGPFAIPQENGSSSFLVRPKVANARFGSTSTAPRGLSHDGDVEGATVLGNGHV